MDTNIYICDTMKERAEKISAALYNEGYGTECFSTLEDVLQKLHQSAPDLFLLNLGAIETGLAEFDWVKSVPIILYGEKLGVDEAFGYYQKGVRRVITGSENLEESVAAAAKMAIYRLIELRKFRQKSLTYGTLQGFSLFKILQNVLQEKKNFVIQIQYKNWKAKIRTFQGHIVDALTPDSLGEDAILKTLCLAQGSFLIRRYQKMEEVSPISTSTLGILAEAKYQRKEIGNFLKRFGISNPGFAVAPELAIAEMPPDEQALLKSITKYHAFQEVLLRCPLSTLKMLRLLNEFLDNGTVVLQGEGSENEEMLNEQDVDYIRENLLPEGAKEGKIIIMGLPSSGKTQFVRTFAGLREVQLKVVQSVEFARIPLDQELNLIVFGLSIDQNFHPLLNKLSEGMLACIFLIDFSQKSKFDYTKYVLHQVLQNYSVPFVIGLTNVPEEPGDAVEIIREKFQVPAVIEIIPTRPESFGHIRQLLYNLKKIPEFMGK